MMAEYCKGCGAPIIFVKTTKGKDMPLDAKPIKAALLREDLTGAQFCEIGDVHMPHWATCPKASDFRRKA